MKPWKNLEIAKAVNSLEAGDWLVVPELSRLGRSTVDILKILAELKRKEIYVYAIRGTCALNGTMVAKVFLHMMALFGEIERDLDSARTREALKARKVRGVKPGRPKGPGKSRVDPFRPEIQALLKNGSSMAFVANRYKVKEPTLFNWLKKNRFFAGNSWFSLPPMTLWSRTPSVEKVVTRE